MTEEPKATSRLAIASFLLSLASFVVGPLGFIPGIVCGHIAKHRIARDATLDDPGFAKAGLVLGYVFLGLSTIVVIAFSLYALGAFAGKPTGAGREIESAQTTLEILSGYLEDYRDYSGGYPTTEQGLPALSRKPSIEPVPERWKYFLPDRYSTDPWGNPLQYRYPGIRNPNSYDLWCLGPDGEAGTADDIIGW